MDNLSIKPRILAGVCEFCGVKAALCPHFSMENAELNQNESTEQVDEPVVSDEETSTPDAVNEPSADESSEVDENANVNPGEEQSTPEVDPALVPESQPSSLEDAQSEEQVDEPIV